MLMKVQGGHETVPTNSWATSGGHMAMPMSQLCPREDKGPGLGIWPGPCPCSVHPVWPVVRKALEDLEQELQTVLG